ncbi:MAG: type IV toxin-antitoxin system AbiEi family antitoxin [Chitinophagales bacterium]|jgi:predicted transcriptional regulator of viral defense system|nr:type IV toxin-antitoxin system AbiEi family antitoxin [Chitinophagales bacterium]
MGEQVEIKIHNWVENLQSQGKYAFSLALIQEQLSGFSAIAIKSSLGRLSKKGLVISIHKGYYLIIPPQYKSKGILPPSLYLDAFMKELNRPYYLALLNAAAYHGASHQQPQEFFVITTFPVLRPTYKKGLKVNYISKKELPVNLLETKKTEAGYLKISNPILTATDLIQYEKRIGGINRVATVLNELAEAIKPDVFNRYLLQNTPVTALQRLGYLLEYEFKNHILADALFHSLKINEAKLFRIPLKASAGKKGFSSENRWKVIVNTEIETDF